MTPERQPTLEEIASHWLCLWEMGWHLLAFTPAALLRELVAPTWCKSERTER